MDGEGEREVECVREREMDGEGEREVECVCVRDGWMVGGEGGRVCV